MAKNSRHQSIINRQSNEEYSENHWLKQFEEKLEKEAVQPHGQSLYDQINSIMNTKGKYPSVQAAVDDMMQRSGLSDYLDNVKTSNLNEEISSITPKNAQLAPPQQSNKKLPKIIENKPSILRTLENIIKSSNGNMPVPAIINKLHSLHSNDVADEGAWEDDDLIRFVSRCNLQAKKNNPASYENFDNLGQGDRFADNSDVDVSNTDAFHALMPAKI